MHSSLANTSTAAQVVTKGSAAASIDARHNNHKHCSIAATVAGHQPGVAACAGLVHAR